MAYTANDIGAIEDRLRRKMGRVLSASESVAESLPLAMAPVTAALRDVLRRLTVAGFRPYLWGGLVRDLLTTRMIRLPRDIDIVVDGARNDQIWELFRDLPGRRNQFGGIHIENGIAFDMFAVADAWAFRRGLFPADIEHIPCTPFLNVEAIVVDAEAKPGHKRQIISQGFFEGLSSEVVDINCESNPYPALCVVRSLVIADTLNFFVGEQLARYLIETGARLSPDELEQTQVTHYGTIRYRRRDVKRILSSIYGQLESGVERIVLPGSRKSQDELWRREDWCVEPRPTL